MSDDFDNDPMMNELHRIREEEHNATWNLRYEERENRRMMAIEEGLKGTGFAIVRLGNGRYKIKRTSQEKQYPLSLPSIHVHPIIAGGLNIE